MTEPRDPMLGRVFGRLTVIGRAEPHQFPSGARQSRYRCRCSCGNEVAVLRQSLTRDSTRSCSCLRRELAPSHSRFARPTTTPEENP